jgi:hypothetical protein
MLMFLDLAQTQHLRYEPQSVSKLLLCKAVRHTLPWEGVAP